MKKWFSSVAAVTTDHTSVGTMQIKEMIRILIQQEDKANPYSDLALVNALKAENIQVSRRTVAKYREELGIRGSYDRKEVDFQKHP